MARTKISEFSATPANNTDIDSINIAEGCAPSGINDAIRELMAQLKDFQTGAVGDSFNGPVGSTTAGTGAFTTLSASGTATLSGLTASTALALDASKNIVSVTNTGTGSNVLATSPTLVTPALGTPSSGVVTNLTGTASININGTVGATTATTGAFTTLAASSTVTLSGGTANGVAYLNGSKVLTSGSALTYNGTTLAIASGGRTVSALGTSALFASNGTEHTLFIGDSAFAYFQLYTPASPTYLSFQYNSAEKMRLTSTGLVGIGTSSPASILDVQQSSAGSTTLFNFQNTSNTASSNSRIKIATGGTSGGNSILQFTNGSSNWYINPDSGDSYNLKIGTAISDSKLVIAIGGDVGIGTSSPSTKLEVAGNAKLTGTNLSIVPSTATSAAYTLNTNTGGNFFLGIDSSTGASFTGTAYGRFLYSGGAYPIVFLTNDLERMRLDSAGTLFVNTTGRPSGVGGGDNGKLWVKQTTTGNYGISSIASATDSFISIANTGTVGLIGTSYGTTGSYLPLAFYTSDLERCRIDTSGNLLVGATSSGGVGLTCFPAGYIRANTSGSTLGQYQYSSSMMGTITTDGANIAYNANNALVFGSGGTTERCRIDSNGNLLVGTTSSVRGTPKFQSVNASDTSALFQCGNNASNNIISWMNTASGTRYHMAFGDGTTYAERGSIATNGTLTTFNTTSDYRLKNNQTPLTGSGSFIDALQPKSWTWAQDGSKGVGFIAHEFAEVSPSSVSGVKDAIKEDGSPAYQSMQASSAEVIANLVAEIQSLRVRVAQLESN